jgi:hypothetical protein
MQVVVEHMGSAAVKSFRIPRLVYVNMRREMYERAHMDLSIKEYPPLVREIFAKVEGVDTVWIENHPYSSEPHTDLLIKKSDRCGWDDVTEPIRQAIEADQGPKYGNITLNIREVQRGFDCGVVPRKPHHMRRIGK